MKEETKYEGNEVAANPMLYLAVERTELALERTHLAWTRTIIVLISSGFAIDSIAEAFHQSRVAEGKAITSQSHIVGNAMVLSAMLLLISECVYYIRRSGELAVLRNLTKKSLPNGIMLSAIIFCVGLLMIFYMFFK